MIRNQRLMTSFFLGALLTMLSSAPALAQNPSSDYLGDTSTLRPKGYKPVYQMKGDSVARGRTLFNDTKLSTNGRSCASCHQDADSFGPRFKQPYPHAAMNSKARFGVDKLQADEIIQICMQGPMKNAPMEWASREQIDLTNYLLKVQASGKM